MEKEAITLEALKGELIWTMNEFKEFRKKESELFEKQRIEFMGFDDENAIWMR